MTYYHIPVMLKEVLKYLKIQKGKWYLDCNLGGGGHSGEIIKRKGRVIGIDLDEDAIYEVVKNYNLSVRDGEKGLRAYSHDLVLIQGNFSRLEQIVEEAKEAASDFDGIWGIIYDLGVSSYQLETRARGFSFNLDAPLDMRMDKSQKIATAQDLINGLGKRELARLFFRYGEERFANVIAREIVKQRQIKKIETTNQLAQIILRVRKQGKHDRTHPATRVFQSLRIAVNNELESLNLSLPQAFNLLKAQGRLVVISFHSLEDKIVKEFMKEQEAKKLAKIITQKPIEPSDDEVRKNPRARSAKLRVLEKLVKDV